MKQIAVAMVRFYQLTVSPWLPPACRHYPSCSAYAIEAIEKHGFFKGFAFTARRVLRCHPFHAGGFDPVPLLCLRQGRRQAGVKNDI